MKTASISFVPSRVEGLDGVSLVTVHSDRIVFNCSEENREFSYRTFGRLQGSIVSRIIDRLRLQKPWRIIGERDWFHPPSERFFRFYTNPQITMYMPIDDSKEYVPSFFCRVQQVWRSGNVDTFDLG